MSRLYCVRQRDATDCGAACVATVCRQYGSQQPLERIRLAAGTDATGTSAFGLVKAAESLGFMARGVRGTIETLLDAESLPLPAIAHIITGDGMLHFVVIQRIREGKITVADPAHGIRTLSAAEFARQWSGILILLAPTANGPIQGSGMVSLPRWFLSLLRGQWWLLLLMTLGSGVVTVIGIVSAFYFKVIIDQIVPGVLWAMLTTVSLAIIAMYVVQALLDAGRTYLILIVQRRIDNKLVLGYYDHVMGLPMSFYGTRRVGDIITRFGDAGKIRQALASAAVTVFIDVVMSVGGCFILATQSMRLFGIAAIEAVLYGVLGVVVLKPVNRLNQDMMEGNAGVTSHFVESIKGAETVKAYNAQVRMKDKAGTLYTSYLQKAFRYGKWQNAQSVIGGSLSTIGSAIILWVGTVTVLQGGMTIGTLVVFTSLLEYFLSPVRNLMNLQPQFQSAAVAARRLRDVLTLEAERLNAEGQVPLARLDGPIVFDQVRFRYGSRLPVLDRLSLTIPKGAAVGLVGESGSGKTTVAKLLMKFYLPESGRIWFGSLDVTDISAETLRERVAYISQNTAFFSGTVAENLRLASPEATPEQMIRACRMAQAHDFITALPGGYQALLEENAANLSGGQRQRLAIARALLRRADMLILDEATSNMDSVSELAVSDTVRRLGSGITRLIIAHRLSTVVACDMIYVMDHGTIVEAGTHEDLLAQRGAYRNLWRAQYTPEPSHQPVSHVAHRGQSLRPDLPAQIPYVHVNDVRAGVKVESPYRGQELLTADDLAGVAQKRLQERELSRREVDLAAGYRHPPCAQVQTETLVVERLRGVAPVRPQPQADPDQQFIEAERFSHVIIRS